MIRLPKIRKRLNLASKKEDAPVTTPPLGTSGDGVVPRAPSRLKGARRACKGHAGLLATETSWGSELGLLRRPQRRHHNLVRLPTKSRRWPYPASMTLWSLYITFLYNASSSLLSLMMMIIIYKVGFAYYFKFVVFVLFSVILCHY